MKTKIQVSIILIVIVSSLGFLALHVILTNDQVEDNQHVSNSLYINSPSPKQLIELYPPQTIWPRTQSAYGNLTQYSVVLNCTIPIYISTAPLLVQYNTSATEIQAKEIADKIFGMKNVTVLEPMYRGEITLATENKREALEVHNLNILSYINTDCGGEKTNSSIREIADALTKLLDDYWLFDTDVVRNFTDIRPSAWSTETSLNGTIISSKTTLYRVSYSYYVNKIPIVGAGAAFNYDFHGSTINSAILRLPIVKVAGIQNVTITPDQALQNFISGWGVSGGIVPVPMIDSLPKTGTCVINSIKLVYYSDWGFKSQYRRYPVLLYEISGKLEYLENGKELSEPFTTYEYATG